MRTFAVFVFVGCCFASINVFAQTPKTIEADLLKSFKRIGYCYQKKYHDTTYDAKYEDSLAEANKLFGKKLKYYAEKYPATIMQNFVLLKKQYLGISTSSDGLFRIYSWDTEEGGTMYSFENVFQYKSGNKTFAVLDTPSTNPIYCKILTVKSNLHQIYAASFLYIESSRYHDEGIQIFKIEGDKLNDKFKAVKTGAGMHSEVNYEYDLSSVKDLNNIPSIIFDSRQQTIKLPTVDVKGRFTKGFINYKFTGKYFEKVKN